MRTQGLSVGEAGTILRTTDGGNQWNGQVSGTTNLLFGLSFVDANTGAAVGAEGTILKTTDGGESLATSNKRHNKFSFQSFIY